MRTHYNRIAGQNLERLAALSDGIFAIAMTLLVLDLHIPGSGSAAAVIGNDRSLWLALIELWPRLLTYFMSFLTLGVYWVAQQTQLAYFTRSDRDLTWIHLGFLLFVSIMPFSTGLLAEYTELRIALFVYWLNIFLLGMMLFWSIRYAKHAGLMNTDMFAEMRTPHEGRIFAAQALYTFGLLLCVINTYWSITFLILVQLNYAIAPRIPLVERFDRWIIQVVSVRMSSGRARSLARDRERAAGDGRQKRLPNTANSHASEKEGLEDQA
jgi:uncharacterized membrane protein